VIVIDASALAKFILKEEGWGEVAEYLKAGTISTDYIVKEVANAVWRRFEQGAISLKGSELMLSALKRIVGSSIVIEDELAHLDEAIRIAFSRHITVYDSVYIAIAKGKRLALLTADEKQAAAAEAERVSLARAGFQGSSRDRT
jgi:predicted nucleic acid-binding protein